MKATSWEFTNRAMLFGLIFAVSFPLYFLDHQNSTVALADWIASRLQMKADLVARLLLAFAALLLVVAALIRTWASSYLHAGVVYAAEVKTASLVADGPYRQVRNPLYFANVLMIIAMGAMMSLRWVLCRPGGNAGVLLSADPAGGGRTSSESGRTVRGLPKSGAASVAHPLAARCFRRTPSHLG